MHCNVTDSVDESSTLFGEFLFILPQVVFRWLKLSTGC